MLSSEAAREEIRGEIRLDCAEGARRGAPEKAKDGWLDTKVTRPSSQGPWGGGLGQTRFPGGHISTWALSFFKVVSWKIQHGLGEWVRTMKGNFTGRKRRASTCTDLNTNVTV